MSRLQITTLAAQDISSPLLVATYTATVGIDILIKIHLSGLAGDGVVKVCLTTTSTGGIAYQSPTSMISLAAGTTTALFSTAAFPISVGDVIKVYAQGQAADTAVAVTTEIFEAVSGVISAGSHSLTYTLTDATTLLPIADALVEVSTDAAKANVVRSGRTDSFGIVTFYLNAAGTYYVWRTKDGYSATEPDVEVVT